MPNATIALIIDCSGSMTSYNYLAYAKTDAATFANIMQIGDGCAVVSFSDDAYLNQALVALSSQSVIDTVCTRIQGIQAVNLTNMSAGLQMANQQIGSSASPRGMLLLSDGMWNRGVDPMTVLPGMPVYTIALGNHGELGIMQQIASQTGGQYNYTPGYRELAQIYNNIVAQSQVAEVATNIIDSVGTLNYKEISTTITSGVSLGTFTVNWDNVNVAYTPDTPVGSQINITLYDPDNTKFSGRPVYVAPGSVVFDVVNPMAGNWTVGCWYAGATGDPPLDCTWGGFEPPGTTALHLGAASTSIKAGDESCIETFFHDHENPIENPIIRATVSSPQTSHEQIARDYAGELEKITPDQMLINDGVSEDKARIITLDRKNNGTLFGRHIRPLDDVTVNKDGRHVVRLTETKVKGTYNVHITAKGYSPRNKCMVQRTGIISIYAE